MQDDLARTLVDAFEGRILAIDQCHHHFTIARRVALLDHNAISIEDAVLDHGQSCVGRHEVDGQPCRVYNARGAGREWNSIDRLAGWLREQGFWYWWTRNDLEPIGAAATEPEETALPASPSIIDPPFSPF